MHAQEAAGVKSVAKLSMPIVFCPILWKFVTTHIALRNNNRKQANVFTSVEHWCDAMVSSL